LQAGGHRFDPDRLHHRAGAETSKLARTATSAALPRREPTVPEMKPTVRHLADIGAFALLFDIVNGFLIDAATASRGFGLAASAFKYRLRFISASTASAFCRVASDRKIGTLSAVVGGADSQA
jgi:hypothetical protein